MKSPQTFSILSQTTLSLLFGIHSLFLVLQRLLLPPSSHRSMVVYNGPPIIDTRPLTHLPPLLLMCCSKFSKSRMRIETNKPPPPPHVSIIVVSVNHGIPCLNNWLPNLCFWEDSIITSQRTSCIYMLISTMCNIVIVIINIIIILINVLINNVEVSISVCEESVLVVTAAPICQNRSQDQIRSSC